MSDTTTDETQLVRPETFRLPKPGESDPYFGFSRSFYYALEGRGHLRLIRILDETRKNKPRKQVDERGRPLRQRGVTLIPYRQVEAFVRAQMEQAQPDA